MSGLAPVHCREKYEAGMAVMATLTSAQHTRAGSTCCRTHAAGGGWHGAGPCAPGSIKPTDIEKGAAVGEQAPLVVLLLGAVIVHAHLQKCVELSGTGLRDANKRSEQAAFCHVDCACYSSRNSPGSSPQSPCTPPRRPCPARWRCCGAGRQWCIRCEMFGAEHRSRAARGLKQRPWSTERQLRP